MRKVWKASLVATGLMAAGIVLSAADPPPWAYARNTPGQRAEPDDGRPHSVPGSTKTYTLKEISNGFSPPDWHPDDHPPMPEVVGKGRAPDVRACGYCHLPTGIGKPENAAVAGLPAAYIKQQIAERGGEADPGRHGRDFGLHGIAGALRIADPARRFDGRRV